MTRKNAKIKVIAGGMKSGKSGEANNRFQRAIRAGMKVQMFKPDKDKTFAEGEIVSRDGSHEKCTIIPAANPEYILSIIDDDVELVIIDEAQFFEPRYLVIIPEGEEKENIISKNLMGAGQDVYILKEQHTIVDIVQKIADRGIGVVVCGLDMDSDRRAFGALPELMAIANEVRKLHAICEICHDEAMYSYANFKKHKQVAVNNKEDDLYVATCPRCYNKLTSGKYTLLTTYDEYGNKEDYTIIEKGENYV